MNKKKKPVHYVELIGRVNGGKAQAGKKQLSTMHYSHVYCYRESFFALKRAFWWLFFRILFTEHSRHSRPLQYRLSGRRRKGVHRPSSTDHKHDEEHAKSAVAWWGRKMVDATNWFPPDDQPIYEEPSKSQRPAHYRWDGDENNQSLAMAASTTHETCCRYALLQSPLCCTA